MLLVLILGIALMCFAADTNDTKTFENSMDKLKTALNKNKFKIVEPLLGEYFTYGSFNCGSGCSAPRMVLEYIIRDYTFEVREISIDNIKYDNPEYRIQASFHFDDGKANQEIVMSEDGKFLDLIIPRTIIQIGDQKIEGNNPSKSCKGCK
jgi:hypothetical protein